MSTLSLAISHMAYIYSNCMLVSLFVITKRVVGGGSCRVDGEAKMLKTVKERRAESTLIASVFSASKSPRVIRRSISSMIVALLRPLTNTLFCSGDFLAKVCLGAMMRGNIHVSQSCKTAICRISFQNQKL